MTDKEKILKYLEYKGVSKNKFYTKTGLSVGFLDSGSSLGVDKLKIIIDNYPDFNPEWLLTGEGSMLKPVAGEEKKTTAETSSSPISPEYFDNYNYLLSELRKKDQLIEELKATIQQLHEQLNQQLSAPPARTGTDG